MNQTLSDLRNKIQAAFLEDDLLEDFGIEVLDSNGVISLRGNVPTGEIRDRAEAVARDVPGVINVINEIDVV
jgi:osmotically-inducible protein OsmY